MRDPGPARSGPALLCSTRWLTHSLQITENRAELPAISPSTQSRHLLSLFIPSSCCSSKRGKKITKGKNQDTTKTETVLWWPKCFHFLFEGSAWKVTRLKQATHTFSLLWTNVQFSFCLLLVLLPPFFLVGALQCLFSVKMRPRLPPCPLAFSSKTWGHILRSPFLSLLTQTRQECWGRGGRLRVLCFGVELLIAGSYFSRKKNQR